MASTYSPSLRLELMATGDQSGTWGDTTNTNLGTLLEQAITGVLSVAEGDTTLTLTTNNGASDQARNAVVNLTGAMTANRNVVVQTANKLYLIKNSTTGGFSIVVKTAAGTGVTIPPSSSQWVYSDGTNVVAGLIGNMPFNNLVQGYTTTATAAGTTTLTVTSTHTQYFTGSTTQTVVLPVTSTLVLGQEFEIVNNSSGSLTVNSSGSNLVATVLAGNTVRVQVILTSGTSAASWNVIASSVPNPLTLSGSSVGYTPLVLTSTEAAAAVGPILNLFRDSASPAANDLLAQLLFNGRDSAANVQEYASIQAGITSPTSTTETGFLDIYTTIAGSRTRTMSVGPNNPNTPTMFLDGYATTATAAGTTTLTVTSAGQQYFTGTSTQTVALPVTSTLILGQTYRIVNNSTGPVTVQSSGANTIVVLSAGTAAIFTCILVSGTTAASWDYKFNSITLTLGTVVASTSGTSIDFTGIPAWAKRLTFTYSGLSTSGASVPIIQIGDSGGVEASGYAGSAAAFTASTITVADLSSGFQIFSGSAANSLSGIAILTLLDPATATWGATTSVGIAGGAAISYSAGAKSLSPGPLDRLRLTTVGGTDTFDAGKVNITWE